jgi:CheY-like chemotaxis protein
MTDRQVLLVDDSRSARYALRLQLQYHGLKVDTADSAEAALVKVRENPPDAIFMDHMMPGMNGLEALETLKRDPQTATIPVVICTTGEDAEARRRAWDKGAVALLAKATASEQLPDILEAIDVALARYPAATEVAPELDDHRVADIARREANILIETTLRPRIGAYLEQSLDDVREHLTREVMRRTEAYVKERLRQEINQLRLELPVEAQPAAAGAQRARALPPETEPGRPGDLARSPAGSLEPAHRTVPPDDGEGRLVSHHLHPSAGTHQRLYLLAAGAAVITLAAAAVFYVMH